MSQLKRYISDPLHVIMPNTIQLKNNLKFVQIIEKKIKLVKVLWNEVTRDTMWELQALVQKFKTMTHYLIRFYGQTRWYFLN